MRGRMRVKEGSIMKIMFKGRDREQKSTGTGWKIF
jgi:hypothetical protein